MPKFLALVLIVFTQIAAAESVFVMDTKISAHKLNPELMVNKELGTAWVDVVEERISSEGSTYVSHYAQVAGLSYNAETKEVIYQNGNEQVVCGNTYNRRFVLDRGVSVRETGRCVFEVLKVKVQVNKGGVMQTKKRSHVYLHVN